jgi:hypothetical protein
VPVARPAKQDDTSVNQFVVVAAAETPSAKATARQFGAPANTDAFDRIK